MKRHHIHAALRRARKAKGLTQTQLAKRASLTKSDVANYETRVIPGLVKLARLARALKLPITALLSESS